MNDEQYRDGPRLVADIGGTNARFALERGPGWIEQTETLACADYPRFQDAARDYLGRHAAGAGVRHAVIAIANPVDLRATAVSRRSWRIAGSAGSTSRPSAWCPAPAWR